MRRVFVLIMLGSTTAWGVPACQASPTAGMPWSRPSSTNHSSNDVLPSPGDTSDLAEDDSVPPGGDGGDASDVRPSSDPACALSIRTDRFPLPFSVYNSPQVAGGDIYTEQIPRGDEGDPEIIRIEPETGRRVQLTSNDRIDRLLEAAETDRGSAVLVRRMRRDGGRATPVVVDRTGESRIIDAFPNEWSISEGRRRGSDARVFDGERFVARLSNDPDRPPGRIAYYDGSRVQTISIGEWIEPPVILTPGGFALSGRTGPISGGGNYELYRWTRATEVQRLTRTETDERYVIAEGRTLYWRSDEGSIGRYDLGRGERTTLRRDDCQSLDAEGSRLLVACQSEESTRGRLADEVYLYREGQSPRRRPTGGAYIIEPELGERGSAVWVEYDDPDATCQGQTTGRVIYVDGISNEVRTLANVGAPCLCCGARFPDLELAYDDGVVAWNYAAPEEDDAPLRPPNYRGGYAVITRSCQ